MKLEFDALTIRFDDTTVIDRLTFSAEMNTLAIIGPSGGGKSTLLRTYRRTSRAELGGNSLERHADTEVARRPSRLQTRHRLCLPAEGPFLAPHGALKTLRSRSPSFMAGRRKKPSVELTNCSSASDFPSTQINARRRSLADSSSAPPLHVQPLRGRNSSFSTNPRVHSTPNTRSKCLMS